MPSSGASQRIVLVGTGTGVGKTHVGELLAAALRAGGGHVAALKPVESGLGVGPSDADRLGEAAEFHVKHPCYGFPDPVSPHLAARRQGVSLELRRIVRWVEQHAARWQIIETAGGLLTPLAPGVTNLELAEALQPAVIVLVGLDRLGILHEVGACMVAISTRGAALAGRTQVVLNEPAEPDASTGTNGHELERLGIALHVVTLPRDGAQGESSARAGQRVLEAVRAIALQKR